MGKASLFLHQTVKYSQPLWDQHQEAPSVLILPSDNFLISSRKFLFWQESMQFQQDICRYQLQVPTFDSLIFLSVPLEKHTDSRQVMTKQ